MEHDQIVAADIEMNSGLMFAGVRYQVIGVDQNAFGERILHLRSCDLIPKVHMQIILPFETPMELS